MQHRFLQSHVNVCFIHGNNVNTSFLMIFSTMISSSNCFAFSNKWTSVSGGFCGDVNQIRCMLSYFSVLWICSLILLVICEKNCHISLNNLLQLFGRTTLERTMLLYVFVSKCLMVAVCADEAKYSFSTNCKTLSCDILKRSETLQIWHMMTCISFINICGLILCVGISTG